MGTVLWVCPWCEVEVSGQSERSTLCECRECSCGAIGLSAPVEDSDEIVDHAIGQFGVERQESSRGFNDLLLADIVRSGVDVQGGRLDPGDPFPRYRLIWFRKRGV